MDSEVCIILFGVSPTINLTSVLEHLTIKDPIVSVAMFFVSIDLSLTIFTVLVQVSLLILVSINDHGDFEVIFFNKIYVTFLFESLEKPIGMIHA